VPLRTLLRRTERAVNGGSHGYRRFDFTNLPKFHQWAVGRILRYARFRAPQSIDFTGRKRESNIY
jgi:hypothetical protein